MMAKASCRVTKQEGVYTLVGHLVCPRSRRMPRGCARQCWESQNKLRLSVLPSITPLLCVNRNNVSSFFVLYASGFVPDGLCFFLALLCAAHFLDAFIYGWLVFEHPDEKFCLGFPRSWSRRSLFWLFGSYGCDKGSMGSNIFGNMCAVPEGVP